MAEDYTITVTQHAGSVVKVLEITGAPSPLNRYDRGVKLLFDAKLILTKPVNTAAWSDLRELARENGLIIDPLDDPAPGDGGGWDPVRRWGSGDPLNPFRR